MPGLLQRFLPREEGFFDLFAKQAANIREGANALLKMLTHYTGVPEQVQIVKAFEHEGDEITHAIFTMSPYSPVSALKPKFSCTDSRILPMTTAPSEPAL